WPAFFRLIAQCMPPIVFGEQTAGKDGREWLAGVRADLEALGYACGCADLCSASVGAPHIRQRLHWVASLADSAVTRSLPRAFGGLYCGEEDAGPRDGEPERCDSDNVEGLANADGW